MASVTAISRSDHPRTAWALWAAIFLGVMAASAGATFGVLSHVGATRAAPSPAPIGIVRASPSEMPVTSRRIPVDSVAEGFRPEPDAVHDMRVGWVDSVRASDDGAVLIVGGWAGDPALGVRIPIVGVGACGTIVATVPVEGERQDVRANVHPNLDRAGWTARIFADHLPSCDGRALEAYAFLPGGRVAAKLALADATIPALAPDGAVADGPAAMRRPTDLAPPETIRMRVAAAHQVLRRCAEPACGESSRVPRGEHRLVVLDRRDGWSLIALPGAERAGWLPEREIDVLPERLAQR